jgi:hypothetical protein
MHCGPPPDEKHAATGQDDGTTTKNTPATSAASDNASRTAKCCWNPREALCLAWRHLVAAGHHLNIQVHRSIKKAFTHKTSPKFHPVNTNAVTETARAESPIKQL